MLSILGQIYLPKRKVFGVHHSFLQYLALQTNKRISFKLTGLDFYNPFGILIRDSI
jgi:hypothetical protein